jgi:hypothetical protein
MTYLNDETRYLLAVQEACGLSVETIKKIQNEPLPKLLIIPDNFGVIIPEENEPG